VTHVFSSMRRVPHTLAVSLAAAVLVLSARPAAAQDPLVRLDPNSRRIVELVLDSAVAAGLPTKSIMSKALEGIARKIDNKRIVDVVRKELVKLRIAYAALGAVDEQELMAASALIEAGAKPEQFAVFKARQKGRSDLEAFSVWADFLARGVPSQEASSAITKLWQEGADDAAFHALFLNVQADILQGLNPGTALQNRIRESPSRAPSSGKPPEGPQENQSSR
jgi:hypothetical protein